MIREETKTAAPGTDFFQPTPNTPLLPNRSEHSVTAIFLAFFLCEAKQSPSAWRGVFSKRVLQYCCFAQSSPRYAHCHPSFPRFCLPVSSWFTRASLLPRSAKYSERSPRIDSFTSPRRMALRRQTKSYIKIQRG